MTSLCLGLVVPCYNEEDAFPETSRQLLALLDRLDDAGEVGPGSTLTFVDDGSVDATWALIEGLHRRDTRVRGIKLSRNCGHQHALLAGLLAAREDVVVSLDADLQDDLEAIPRMLQAHRAGAQIVYGVRARRTTDTPFKRLSARGYYAALRRMGVDLVADHADFRLMSRSALDALGGFREVNLFLRGVIPLLGFPSAVVTYDRLARTAGETKYPLGKMIRLAMDGVFAFSTAPLRWISTIGVGLSIASLLFGLWALAVRMFTSTAIPGWASTVVPMYFLGGLQLLALGVIGGYLSRIYGETRQRPRFIVEKSL